MSVDGISTRSRSSSVSLKACAAKSFTFSPMLFSKAACLDKKSAHSLLMPCTWVTFIRNCRRKCHQLNVLFALGGSPATNPATAC